MRGYWRALEPSLLRAEPADRALLVASCQHALMPMCVHVIRAATCQDRGAGAPLIAVDGSASGSLIAPASGSLSAVAGFTSRSRRGSGLRSTGIGRVAHRCLVRQTKLFTGSWGVGARARDAEMKVA